MENINRKKVEKKKIKCRERKIANGRNAKIRKAEKKIIE